MLARLPAASVRAALVLILVLTPAALLDGMTRDGLQVLALVAFFAAAFTLTEYLAVSPSLVEFRSAPPFNRARFSALFAIVLSVAMIFRGSEIPSPATDFVQQTGAQMAVALDFPYSPVRLMVQAMPDGASIEQVDLLRSAAGVSYLIALISVIGFVVLLRLQRWPRRDVPFNVWVNLPQFDPTAGGDVVKRLQRDGRINVILGVFLPFLVPVVLQWVTSIGALINLGNPQTLIWIVATWAFLPASILMRGVALTRVGDMIVMQRDKARLRGGVSGSRLR